MKRHSLFKPDQDDLSRMKLMKHTHQTRSSSQNVLNGRQPSATPSRPFHAQKETVLDTDASMLPETLKTGIEGLAGLSLDDVKVHYNSSKPANLDALAYAQDNNIHLGPGQEKHLAHEAWHIVQQRKGLVKPTIETRGVSVNDDSKLEREADVMGAKALKIPQAYNDSQANQSSQKQAMTNNPKAVIQNKADIKRRQRLNKKVNDAIKLISAGGPVGNNATQAEIRAHDEAMNPGQHHAMRNVNRANLIADLRQRKLDHANNNIRDTDELNSPAIPKTAARIAQLRRKSIP